MRYHPDRVISAGACWQNLRLPLDRVIRHHGFVDNTHLLNFESWEFAPGYRIVPYPEYPGNGRWRHQLFCFDRSGALAPDPVTRWGAALTVEVHPADSPAWVGSFASGGLGGISALSAGPSPTQLVVVVDGLAYLVDVESPTGGASIADDQVTQIVPVGTDLLLLVRFIDIVAIGPKGLAWLSARLAVDDLRVEHSSTDRIVCSCELLDDGRAEIVLDPRTGAQIAGPRLDSFWPPDAM